MAQPDCANETVGTLTDTLTDTLTGTLTDTLADEFAQLQPGDHLCCLCDEVAQRRTVVTAFLRQGLARDEKVLYILDVSSAQDVLDDLRQAGIQPDPYLDAGQLAFWPHDAAYLQGGVFDPDRMVMTLAQETEHALEAGYAALRVTGEMTWVLRGLPGSERLIEYEAKLNDFFPAHRCLALCQYDRQRFEADLLLDVLRTHPWAVIDGSLYDNMYYIPPEELLGDDVSAATLDHWVNNLVRQKRDQEALLRAHETLEQQVQKRTAELAQVNATLRLVIDLVPDLIYVKDAEGRFLLVNQAGAAFAGQPIEAMEGHRESEWIEDPAVLETIQAEDRAVTASGKAMVVPRQSYRDAAGEQHLLHTTKIPFEHAPGEPPGVLGVSVDVTERERLLKETRRSAETNALLLQELHHRVKNNLQIISSLLRLQAEEVQDPDLRAVLEDSQHRVRAIALVHDKLHRTGDLSRISMVDYIKSEVSNLMLAYGHKAHSLDQTLDIDPAIIFDLDTAMHCGLIINELVTNVFKHAFPLTWPGPPPGKLDVIMRQKESGSYCLIVRDNGVGLPETVNPATASTLGMRLVAMLTEQLEGTLDIQREGGTTFCLRFDAESIKV